MFYFIVSLARYSVDKWKYLITTGLHNVKGAAGCAINFVENSPTNYEAASAITFREIAAG
jgi:hypothetical protein